METINLCFRGKLTAKVVHNTSELPKGAKFHDCDNLETNEGLIGESVNIYIFSSKKGLKYFVYYKKRRQQDEFKPCKYDGIY